MNTSGDTRGPVEGWVRPTAFRKRPWTNSFVDIAGIYTLLGIATAGGFISAVSGYVGKGGPTGASRQGIGVGDQQWTTVK